MTDLDPGVLELERWLLSVTGLEWLWHLKYLSANDTYAKPNVHQGGPHISKALLAAAFPRLSVRAKTKANPDLILPSSVDSHGESVDLRLIWYNSKRAKGQRNGRDEARLTNWGGKDSAMVEADATGSLVLMAFRIRPGEDADAIRVWRCRSSAEEDYLLERVDGVEPGRSRMVSPVGAPQETRESRPCALREDEIPPEWRESFPTGEDIVRWVVANRNSHKRTVDDRLIIRRECEYEVFRSIESVHAMPRIAEGFGSVDSFVEFASSLMQRRKSRSGRSLELHARQIFLEEGVSFSWTSQTEGKKTPDFIFPSIDSYHDSTWPADRLRMLAAKTTCKDRWRQVINEADRIPLKHLLTLQEGVSVPQYTEMVQHGIQLVVPRRLIRFYPDMVAEQILTLEQFVAEVRDVAG